ncbi:hypothetical protein SBI_07098 [Streptomyces bingchenggensis BCW-1]|uniref:Uncharacterized protein n=1 Tax=Streptomyces bingchenggensis (strain BCW-1) TaxID=749414 RepID=D7C3J3_STRBB|nr:hypothetical protein SBI_07098 [Streptomyces bingchenggensis BCW-1]
MTSARAIATRCCCPPESRPGRRLACSCSPTWASTARARARSGRAPASRIGSTTFCSTVSEGSRLKDWKTKPRRLRRSAVSLFSLMPVISVPPSRTEPAVGRSRPAAHCRNVDLPEPEGPITAVKLPWGRVRSMPRRACTAREPRPYWRRTPRSSTAAPCAPPIASRCSSRRSARRSSRRFRSRMVSALSEAVVDASNVRISGVPEP